MPLSALYILQRGLKEPIEFGLPQRLWVLVSLDTEATKELGL